MGKERRIITLILSCLFILCHVATAFSSFPQTSFRATFLRTTSSALRHLVIKRQSSSSTPEGSSTSRRRSRDPSTRRPDRPRPARRRNPPSSSTRAARRTAAPRKRAPHQFDHTKEDSRPFVDAATEIERQSPNEDAPTYDLDASRDLRCISLPQESEQKEEQEEDGRIISHPHIEFYSLDDLFPGLDFSHRFSTSQAFREELRNSIREDIFDSTASYSSLPEKARRVLLLPDSSLQGTWKCSSSSGGGGEKEGIRMKKLTNVLAEHLGPDAPNGDVFLETIGSLCRGSEQYHWMDIVGISGRRITHSWHQDTGGLPGANDDDGGARTVMLGFPCENEYDGIGVFSAAVKLLRERWAPDNHPPNEPLVYKGTIPDEYIVKPRIAEGREILAYRDVDILHSAPDVTYRASVMRFM